MIDRLIQQAILQVLTPIFDPEFSESSFGFRPGRCAHGAAKQVQPYIRAGYRHCVDMDLSKFFDRVQHDVVMTRVSREVHEKRLLALIGRYPSWAAAARFALPGRTSTSSTLASARSPGAIAVFRLHSAASNFAVIRQSLQE